MNALKPGREERRQEKEGQAEERLATLLREEDRWLWRTLYPHSEIACAGLSTFTHYFASQLQVRRQWIWGCALGLLDRHGWWTRVEFIPERVGGTGEVFWRGYAAGRRLQEVNPRMLEQLWVWKGQVFAGLALMEFEWRAESWRSTMGWQQGEPYYDRQVSRYRTGEEIRKRVEVFETICAEARAVLGKEERL